MLKFFGRILSGFISVIAVIALIVGAISGFLFVDQVNPYAGVLLHVLGSFLGLLIAFVMDVLTFGTLGILIEMRDSLEEIRSKADRW